MGAIGACMSRCSLTVVPPQTSAALETLLEACAEAGVSCASTMRRLPSTGFANARPDHGGGRAREETVDLCMVLGGDGTILRALRRYSGTGVPVFAINFGDIGFLATIEPEELADGLRRALQGDFELLRLPAIVLDAPDGPASERSTTWRSTARWASESPRSPMCSTGGARQRAL